MTKQKKNEQGHFTNEYKEESKEPQKGVFEEPFDGSNVRQSRLERMQCWPEVKAMIEMGAQVSDIVRHIQDKRGEYLDVKPSSLATVLYNWVTRHRSQLLDKRLPTRYLTLLNSVAESVDMVDAVNMLFAIQMERVMLDFSSEVKHKRSTTTNTHNLKLANEMVRTMSFLASDSFKMKAALKDATDLSGHKNTAFENMERVKKAYEDRFGQKAAAVALNPESRSRVFNALNRIRKGDAGPVLEILKANTDKAKSLIKENEQDEMDKDAATFFADDDE